MSVQPHPQPLHAPHASALRAFLDAHAASRGGPSTHTLVPGGSFLVPDEDYDELLCLYGAALDEGHGALHLTEAIHRDGRPVPLLIDLDLRLTQPDHAYDLAGVRAVCKEAHAYLARFVDLRGVSGSLTCVLTKPVRPHPNKPGVWKDGVHLHMPLCVVPLRLGAMLRAHMLEPVPCDGGSVPRLLALLGPQLRAALTPECTADAVWDGSVTRWLMYGSRKGKPDDPDPVPFTVAQWIQSDEHGECIEVDADTTAHVTPSGIARMLAVRQPPADDVPPPLAFLGPDAEAAVRDGDPSFRGTRAASAATGGARERREGAGATLPHHADMDLSAETVLALTRLLHHTRISKYQDWMKVGIALLRAGRGTDKHWDAFHALSVRDAAGYGGEADCRRQWDRWPVEPPAGGRPVTLGTLCDWARADAPLGYSAWRVRTYSRPALRPTAAAAPPMPTPDAAPASARGGPVAPSPLEEDASAEKVAFTGEAVGAGSAITVRLRELGLLADGTVWRLLPSNFALDAPVAAATAVLPQLTGYARVLGAGFLTVPGTQPEAYPESSNRLFILLAGDVNGSEERADTKLLGIQPGTLQLSLDGCVNAGYMHSGGVPSDAELCTVHTCIKSGLQWVVQRCSPTIVQYNGYDNGTYEAMAMKAQPVYQIEVACPDDSAQCAGKIIGCSGKNPPKVPKDKMALLHAVHKQALERARDTYGVTPVVVYYNNCFNNNVVTVHGGDDAYTSDFEVISAGLLEDAQRRGLRKKDGVMYEPVPGCPCGFRQLCTYEKYINNVLKHTLEYRRNPRRFKDMMEFLTNYEVDELPELNCDAGLLSFSNGVLSLNDMVFTAYGGDLGPVAGRVARHHIDQPYTGSADTPLLDKIFYAQAFAPEVADLLCAMLGRTLFRLGSMDRWQVLLYLVGLGGTGKSLLLTVLQHLLAPGAVGLLGGRREEVFGLANLVDKELIMGRDMPARLSLALPQEAMQSMASGEMMEIPRKGRTALHVQWTAPLVLASNHTPDYVNSGNNVSRRLVVFRFDELVLNPQEDLEDRMLATELPQIVCRFLRAYHAARERAVAAGGFWRSVPPQLLEWQGMLAAATSKLHKFLAMDADERGWEIEHVDGHVTWLMDFKAAFEAKMECAFTCDTATFHHFGFKVGAKEEHVCKTCKQLARGGRDKCCASYHVNNRGKKNLIHNMRIKHIMQAQVAWRAGSDPLGD